MENYQTFFPSSSTPVRPTASSDYHYPSSNMVNFHVFSDLHGNSIQNGYYSFGVGAAGGGGLKSENNIVAPELINKSENNMVPLVVSDANTSDAVKSSSSNGKKKSEKKVRNQRFAFQTRSQVDILDDGYRWRKYGQKAVKNNKHPRSYYRCTHQGCSVKKQVQRLSKDEGIVVTTYEGTHSHPIEKSTDNFEHILSQMQIYPSF